MQVKELIKDDLILQTVGRLDLLGGEVSDIVYSTADCQSDRIFFAMKGRSVDAAQFIPQAYAKGVRVFVSETLVDVPDDALLVVVSNSRLALSYASHVFFNKPSLALKVVGVTGTKGKTTTTTLLFKIFQELGIQAGVIGTNGIYYKDVFVPTKNTTPESYEIHKILRQMVDAGVEVCFMEVSSQGLMMGRVEDVHFFVGVFTNMAVDHIGELEHPTFEDYIYWKTHLFDLATTALVNQDDQYVSAFTAKPGLKVYSYGLDLPADFTAQNLSHKFDKDHIGMAFSYQGQPVLLPVPGRFNVYNALVVLAIAQLLGVAQEAVIKALRTATVPGRMEIIPNQKGVLALLDFAHNGFALENVLTTMQQYEHKRLIVLFGSVGDRSKTRRKELGDVVAKFADIAVITSDNPGHEEPMAIIEEIAASFAKSSCQVYQEADRRKAIALAVGLAQAGDILVFAGKGHETYQLIGDVKEPFVEKDEIIKAFAN